MKVQLKFKFYPTESIINDFLAFPKLYIGHEADLGDSEYNQFMDDEYLSFLKKAKEILMPYEKEIALFYPQKNIDFYSFSTYLPKANSFFGYDSIESYLDFLLTLDTYQIKKSIVKTLLKIQEQKEIDVSKLDSVLEHEQNIMSLIKEIPIDSAAKWDLYLMIEEPIKYRDQFIDLLYRLLPLFYKIYEPYKEKLISYGMYLEDYFNKHGKEGVAEISYSMFDPTIIEGDPKNFLVSFIESYTLAIAPVSEIRHFVWGLKLEKLFQGIKEQNENKLNERVLIFKNLGDKTRYEVLKLIASGEYSIKKIATILGVSSATIAYHFNALLTSKIIKLDKNNSRVCYTIDHDKLKEAMDGLLKDLEIS